MKRFLLLIISGLLLFSVSNAQLINQNNNSTQTQADLDWFNSSYDADGVYGAEVNKAYEFLKNKKVKKTPIVALIGSGIDVEHEDLLQSIWNNPKEKLNNKDDDKNGYVDDINGWNFLGGKDGNYMEYTTREGEREFLRLKDKYADYFFNGSDFYIIKDGKMTKVNAPENMEEYRYYRDVVLPESQIARLYGGWKFSYILKEYAEKYNTTLKERFPNQVITMTEFNSMYDPSAPTDSIADAAFMLIAYGFSTMRTEKWDDVYKIFNDERIIAAQKAYEDVLNQYGIDNRKNIVGDNYLDINDKKYGNNILLTGDAATATMQAGIIAAKRDNGIGINGIIDEARIMTLRVIGAAGEPYLKDMALAIHYAVDNNADIIVLPQQNTLYPEEQKQWISDALKYAEQKGVLVIVPVWELSLDLSSANFYPNRFMTKDKELTNLMTVGSSDKEGFPTMNTNYGMNELDLFAPGVAVYSTYVGDTYQIGTGVGLAAASVAGVAALVKAYYPNLSGSQIRNILNESVTSRKGVEVEKGIIINGQHTQDLFLFEELSISGGILNAYQAVQKADSLSK